MCEQDLVPGVQQRKAHAGDAHVSIPGVQQQEALPLSCIPCSQHLACGKALREALGQKQQRFPALQTPQTIGTFFRNPYKQPREAHTILGCSYARRQMSSVCNIHFGSRVTKSCIIRRELLS